MTSVLFGIYQIFKKPWVFLITTAMLATGLIVSTYSLLVYHHYHYPLRCAKRLMNYDVDKVYSIDFGITMLGLHAGDAEHLKAFVDSMGRMDGIRAWGGYYAQDDASVRKLYLMPSLLPLCSLRDAENRQISFAYGEAEQRYGRAFVGAELSASYPVGSIYHDEESGCDYVIAGVLQEGSEWLSDGLYGSTLNLDEGVVLDLDYMLSEDSFYLLNACANLLIAGEGDGIREEVSRLAEESELDITGVTDLDTQFKCYARDAMRNAGESYLLPFVLLFAAVSVSIITSKMSVLENRKDYGIMISNGFTRGGIIGVALTENAAKCVCAFLVSVLYWRIQYRGMDTFMRELYEDMFMLRFALFLIIAALSVQFPVRYLLRSRPYELLNKKEL